MTAQIFPFPGYIIAGRDMRDASERAQEEREEYDRELHESGECWGFPRCEWCVIARQNGEDSNGG